MSSMQLHTLLWLLCSGWKHLLMSDLTHSVFLEALRGNARKWRVLPTARCPVFWLECLKLSPCILSWRWAGYLFIWSRRSPWEDVVWGEKYGFSPGDLKDRLSIKNFCKGPMIVGSGPFCIPPVREARLMWTREKGLPHHGPQLWNSLSQGGLLSLRFVIFEEAVKNKRICVGFDMRSLLFWSIYRMF